jgi:phage terminase large subunit
MTPNDIILHDKHKAVLKDKNRVIFLEGVTGSSKSFIAGLSFYLRAFNSGKNKTQFVIAATSTTVAEKMFIDNPSSFVNIFNQVCEYKKQGTGGSRIEIQTPTGLKIIYLVGYDNRSRYKQILGLSVHGFLIEEVHVAGDEFIQEAFTRLYRDNGFMYVTGNAGLPDQIVYKDYLNKARPPLAYAHELPPETWVELNSSEADDTFSYYFFRFDDNPLMTQEQIEAMYKIHPVGSFEYNSKIIAVRGFTEGLLYAQLIDDVWIDKDTIGNRIRLARINPYVFEKVYVGIDLGSTAKTIFTIVGITREYQRVVVLEAKVLEGEFDYNDIVNAFNTWFMEWYSLLRKIDGIMPDSADPLFIKTLRNNILIKSINITGSIKKTIKDRIDLKQQLLFQKRLLFTERADNVRYALAKIRADGKGGHIDTGDINIDFNDSLDYALTPAINRLMSYKMKEI